MSPEELDEVARILSGAPELDEVARILSGGDPDWVDDDPSAYDPPAPLSAKDAAAADAIVERSGKAR